MIFLRKNEWTDVDLNRWFDESDLDVARLAAAAVRAIEDWLDGPAVEFEWERYSEIVKGYSPIAHQALSAISSVIT